MILGIKKKNDVEIVDVNYTKKKIFSKILSWVLLFNKLFAKNVMIK